MTKFLRVLLAATLALPLAFLSVSAIAADDAAATDAAATEAPADAAATDAAAAECTPSAEGVEPVVTCPEKTEEATTTEAPAANPCAPATEEAK
ncbi:hypothetical protein QUF50_00355 [Thiotrichales bacterium HSG1]|nr:hypothetical protein [Thiotrichales bacterium HSG1]